MTRGALQEMHESVTGPFGIQFVPWSVKLPKAVPK